MRITDAYDDKIGIGDFRHDAKSFDVRGKKPQIRPEKESRSFSRIKTLQSSRYFPRVSRDSVGKVSYWQRNSIKRSNIRRLFLSLSLSCSVYRVVPEIVTVISFYSPLLPKRVSANPWAGRRTNHIFMGKFLRTECSAISREEALISPFSVTRVRKCFAWKIWEYFQISSRGKSNWSKRGYVISRLTRANGDTRLCIVRSRYAEERLHQVCNVGNFAVASVTCVTINLR